jgi:hypothetical protein
MKDICYGIIKKMKSKIILIELFNNRIEKEKNICDLQEKIECTFAPEITRKNVEFLKPKLDKHTRKYVDRINKAKKLKEEINSKLNPDYSKI